ncbi:hypothetical protein L7F22_013605 [Adiantum nelumboides]|nr:hypothetical protein [Adiantum nelumboides]
MYKPPVKRVEIRRVIFEEDGHVYRPARNDGDHAHNGEQEQPQEGGNTGNDEPVILRRSTRVSRPPNRYVPTMDYVIICSLLATRPDIAFAVGVEIWISECLSGYLYTYANGAISWFSRLQSSTTLSTTEAEYVATSDACKEAIWLTRLVGDLGIVGEIPVLHCDSQSAIQFARNRVFHAKTKHVNVRYHIIRDVLDDRWLHLVKVHTDDNRADVLTKTLSPERFTHCRELMGIG